MTVGSDAGAAGAAPPVVTVDVMASGGSFTFGNLTCGIGPYKRYMRAPHRDVLACRGLAQRGKLRTEHRALNFIARQGDNGIVWTVLSYWRATT